MASTRAAAGRPSATKVSRGDQESRPARPGAPGKALIQGLRTKALRVMPDERGRLFEMLRRDDELFLKFGQAYCTTVNAGVGYGGFCFPKDVEAFIKISETLGYDFDLLKAVRNINEQQKKGFAEKIRKALWVVKGKTIGALGLAFKPNTDDMRYAPAIDIIEYLQGEGAAVQAFDPQAMHEAAALLPKVKLCKDPYQAAKGADCLVILTEWNEFKELDFSRIKKLLRQPLIIDGRNIYDPKRMKAMGFRYLGVGRGRSEAH